MAKPSLVSYIQKKSNEHWTPELISGRIKLELDKHVISFSTIYTLVYIKIF